MPKKDEDEKDAAKKEKTAQAEKDAEPPAPQQLDRDQLEALREKLQKKYH